MTFPNITGVRLKYQSIEEQFKPRLARDVPRGEDPKWVPEAFLADALATIRALCDHIETLESGGSRDA